LLPVEDGFEKQLLDKLVAENCAFVKGLHYNLGKDNSIASVALTDCEGPAPMLFIVTSSAKPSAMSTFNSTSCKRSARPTDSPLKGTSP